MISPKFSITFWEKSVIDIVLFTFMSESATRTNTFSTIVALSLQCFTHVFTCQKNVNLIFRGGPYFGDAHNENKNHELFLDIIDVKKSLV